MSDEWAESPSSPICPWCSKPLPAGAVLVCPSCGAALDGDTEAQVPGVTALDAASIARPALPQRRNRLMSWITGDEDEGEAAATPGSLAPPPPDVRREMLRMELEAEVADLQAEVGSLTAEAREAGLESDVQELEAVMDDAAALREDAGAADEGDVPVADDAAARPATTGRLDERGEPGSA